MTELLGTSTVNKGVIGEIMILTIQTPSTTATGDTIDLKSDTAAGVVMSRIHNVYCEDDAGATKLTSWDPATGIITFGTLVTGIHNVTVIGR
jgi:hypothetical protein